MRLRGGGGGGRVAGRQWGGSVRQAASSLWCHSGAASQRKLLNLLLLLVLLLAFESRSCVAAKAIAFEVVFVVISSNCERNEKKAQQSWVKHGCNEQVTLSATSSTTEHLFISYHII